MKKTIYALVVSFLVPVTLGARETPPGPQEYWVSPAGNDTTGDGSQANPWQHINYALEQIGTDYTVPQRILHVMPGVYAPSATGEVFPIAMKR